MMSVQKKRTGVLWLGVGLASMLIFLFPTWVSSTSGHVETFDLNMGLPTSPWFTFHHRKSVPKLMSAAELKTLTKEKAMAAAMGQLNQRLSVERSWTIHFTSWSSIVLLFSITTLLIAKYLRKECSRSLGGQNLQGSRT